MGGLTLGPLVVHDHLVGRDTTQTAQRGCSSVVEHLLAKERVESSNLFIRLLVDSFERINLSSFFCLQLLINPFRVDLCVYPADLLR